MAKIEKDMKDKLKEAKVAQKEIKQTAFLKAELAKLGMDIPTLINSLKDIKHGK
jgi:hypothetical protein